ncbi:MAG TPA: glycogen synthase, partial [Dehalococcoidia bacterium]|nr:glycogen synthase [Dehalococcoidia bacterium]
VFHMLSRLDWQPEVIHCHDWHTALIPTWVRREGLKYATVFTIHNLAYQGSFDHTFLAYSELDKDWQLWPPDAPEPVLNFLSQGILWADVVTTVSETYAKEILTPEYGEGLERLLCYRREQLVGIVNGLDYEEYNPATDRFIPLRYDISTADKKVGNKLALQRHAGFTEDVEMPLIGMVSRLDEQKGLDIVIESFDYFFRETKAQMVILGRGREQYHSLLRQAADKYPERLAVFIEFDDILARLIYAGCDIFLMPSRFEPCGLGQLIAMRYGAVPLVRHTGGLADTIEDLTPDLGEGSGFVFKDYDSDSMLVAVKRAVDSYRNKEGWWGVVRRIMALDFSWQASAKKYESLYRSLLEQKKHVMG